MTSAAERAERPERVLVEFVSANPTGPLTAAQGRHAGYGDSLARLLTFAGHRVEREYYLNDAGGQVRRFAESIAARMQGREPPEEGYQGEYVAELARELSAAGADPGDLDDLARRGIAVMREPDRGDAGSLRRPLRQLVLGAFAPRSRGLERSIETLRERGHVYESEGAIWLRTTAFGDDKDRVLIRSDGEPTYFGADIAYHRDKLERGAERLVDPLGADHHGYVARMRAAIEALGADPDRFEAPLIQFVHLVEGTARAQMSKRRASS